MQTGSTAHTRWHLVTWATLAFLLCSCITILAAEHPAIGPLPARKPPDPKAVEMGKRLFFDDRLSGDEVLNCSTCHSPEMGWGAGAKTF